MHTLIFDLDNTLYREAYAGIVAEVDRRIESYLLTRLGIPDAEVGPMRERLWGSYGTTLTGLMETHRVDPDEYLDYIHQIDHAAHLSPDPRLDAMLASIAAPKMIFTNGPLGHASRALEVLGVGRHFERIFTIETMNYRAKPWPQSYQQVLSTIGRQGRHCTFIDDIPANHPPARALGMRTVLVHRDRDSVGQLSADHHLDSIYDLVEQVLRPNGIR